MEIYNLSNPSFMKLMRKEDWKIIKDAFKGVLKPVNNFVYMNFFFFWKSVFNVGKETFFFPIKKWVGLRLHSRHKKITNNINLKQFNNVFKPMPPSGIK